MGDRAVSDGFGKNDLGWGEGGEGRLKSIAKHAQRSLLGFMRPMQS
jgi:hypothetical protein